MLGSNGLTIQALAPARRPSALISAPFSVVNYAAALTSIPYPQFIAATVIGSAPGTVAAVLLGDSLTSGDGAAALWATVGFAAVGLAGMVLDARLPVRPAP